MVKFSDLERDSLVPSKTSGSGSAEGIKQSGLSFRRLEKDRLPAGKAGPPQQQSREQRSAIYDAAADYLKNVLEAIRGRHKFSLDPAIQIIRRIIESQPSANDPLLIRAISQEENASGFLVNHCINVAVFAVKLAAALDFDRTELERIGLAALLHEVGMGVIPERLIYKEEKLDAKEYEIFKKRPEFSYKILKGFGENHGYLAETALQVHERIDGSGYPMGLKGGEINVYAQIIGLVDTYEALIHSRPQREKFLHFSAVKQIIKIGKRSFQKKYLKTLLNIFSIFPLNSYVKLNSNAVGRVVETYAQQPMRPKVEVVYDSQGRRVLTKHVVDLAENSILYIVDSISEKDVAALAQGPGIDTYPSVQRKPSSGSDSSAPHGLDDDEFTAEDIPEISEADFLPDPPAAGEVEPNMGPSRGGRQPAAVEGAEVRVIDLKNRARARRVTRLLIAAVVILAGIGAYWSGLLDFWAKKSAGSRAAPKPSAQTAPADRRQKSETVPAEASRLKAKAPPDSVSESAPSAAGDSQTRTAAGKRLQEPAPEKPSAAASGPESALPALANIQPLGSQGRPQPGAESERGGRKTASAVTTAGGTVAGAPPEGAYPYSVKLAHFRSVEEAREAVSEFDRKGIKAYWVKVDLGSQGIWYRVFAGHFETAEKAQAAAAEIGLQGAVVKPTKYSAFIGFFPPDGIKQELELLAGKGFCPYVIQDEKLNRLYVGAFYTRKGAAEQQAELASHGIQSRIVER